jgi:Glyoxalase-like domain
MELDHVLIPVADLSDAVAKFEARYGLASVEGAAMRDGVRRTGSFPSARRTSSWSRVVDTKEAVRSAFGRWVAAARPGWPLGWAVRTDDLVAVAARLGLSVGAGSRLTATGELLRWRIAGVEQSMDEPSLPFFIEWASGVAFPGTTRLEQTTAVQGIKVCIGFQ